MQKSSPKVLFFTTHFYPYRGGLENYVLEVARQLSDKAEVGILTLKHKPLPDHSRYAGIDIYRMDSQVILPGVYAIPKPSLKNLRIVADLAKKYDVFITQTRFFSTSLLGAILAKFYGRRHIHTEHGNVFVKHDNKIVELLARIYDESFGRFIFNSANITIGISTPCVNFARRMGSKNSVLIYNGIDLLKFKHPTKSVKIKLVKQYNPQKKKVIIFVGRLIYAKGVHDLISACKGLDVRLFVIGDGPYLQVLENLSKHLGVDTRFFGEKSQAEIIQLLSISDVFVNPSYSEGLPTSVLEAAAMGVPVVATDVGGTREIVKKGVLIKPRDVTALTNAIKKQLRSRQTRENLQVFDMSNIAKRIYRLL